MAEDTLIYGVIEGRMLRKPDGIRSLQDANLAVVRALPEDDSWPPLTGDMFSAPGEAGTYVAQALHFGCTFKHDDDGVGLWIAKFEALLAKLYWWSAVAHLRTPHSGAIEIEWRTVSGQDPEAPATTWQRVARAQGEQLPSLDEWLAGE